MEGPTDTLDSVKGDTVQFHQDHLEQFGGVEDFVACLRGCALSVSVSTWFGRGGVGGTYSSSSLFTAHAEGAMMGIAL